MISAILNLPSPQSGAAIQPQAGSSSNENASTGESFNTTLTDKISVILAAPKSAASGPPAAQTAAALEAKIAKLLRAGASDSDVIAALSAQLAGSVAQQLGMPGTDARALLQAVFAGALAPPGAAGRAEQSISERARNLAHRFREIQTVAAGILSGQSGQNRIAGNFLDAHSAKETPARDSTDRAAVAGGNAVRTSDIRAGAALTPATAVSVDLPNTAPAAVEQAQAGQRTATEVIVASSRPDAATGDGRRVKAGLQSAIATGGDTALGRILTRAMAVADARDAAAGFAANAGSPNRAAGLSGDASPTASSAVSQFVKLFEGALSGASHLGTPQPHGLPQIAGITGHAQPSVSPALGSIGHLTADASTSFVPAIAPFSIERTPSPGATTTAHAAPIDQGSIVDQVLRGALLRNVGTSSEMRLALTPATLGDVSVKLIVTAGSVTAHIIAQTPEVRDALVSAQPQLTKSLADAGLKLQSFTVDVAGGGFAGFSGQPGDQRQGGQPARDTTRADDSDDSALDAIPSFGPPNPTAASAGDYNYLA